MGWIERTCDRDPHGFLTYAQGEKGTLYLKLGVPF